MSNKSILIVGASGVVGRAAIEHFASLPDWRVTGLSRRIPDTLGDAELSSLDLMDRSACEAVLGSLDHITHVVYAALFEKPGLVKGWREDDQMQTNLTMLKNLYEPLSKAAPNLEHFTLLQGTKAYGAHMRPIAVPARERSPRDNHANFYWLQEDYIRDQQRDQSWHWTVMRPQIIFGHALGVPMNMLAAIGVYAAICKAEGKALAFPGGAPVVFEGVDARLLASAFEWAATSPQCGNEIFNITNGDVFVWRNVWPTIAATLGMDVGDDQSCLLQEEMPKKAALWDNIVAQHGLQQNTMQDLVGDSFFYADFSFAHGLTTSAPPAIVSTIKARQFGFQDCMDTEDMFTYWFERLRDMKILPPL